MRSSQCSQPLGKPSRCSGRINPIARWRNTRRVTDNSGHLWGHVQVIKPPTLLEICGPLMMSYPALNHLQYRLKAEGGVTRLVFLHRAMGLILPEHRDGLPKGWEHWLRLRPEPLREATRWLEHYREFWDARLDALEALLVGTRGHRP